MQGDKYQVFYDSNTGQLGYIHAVNVLTGVPIIPEGNKFAIDVFPVEEASFIYPITEPYDHVLYNVEDKTITIKPKVTYTVSPEPGTVVANGQDFYTINFDILNSEGLSQPWSTIKIKDENGIAQVSSEEVKFEEPHVVKVRSFVPGLSKIRLKEAWDGESTISDGSSFVRYGRVTVELKFKNPTGW